MALETRSDIQLRIHAPFADLYPDEMDYWLVRLENRGKETIPVPDGSTGLTDEVPPPQFRIQTKTEADLGGNPRASSWEEILSFADGSKKLMDKSVLEPGQAMEAFSWGLPGQLRTPPQSGTFRIAMQVGPDEFVYSNWMTRTRHDKPVTDMRTLHIDDPWGNGSKHQIALSENTQPQYLWFFSNKPKSRYSHPSLYRICEVPEGMVPEIKLDRERGQYVISFPPGGPDTVYFAHRCGISKATPWPIGYQGKDYLLTSYPISEPSPIGFPMALFLEDVNASPPDDTRETSSTAPSSKRNLGDGISKAAETGGRDRSIMWISVTCIIFLILLISLSILKFRRRASR
jgi:hypothetical protein